MNQNPESGVSFHDTLVRILQAVTDVESQITSLVQTPAQKLSYDRISSATYQKLLSDLETQSLTLNEKLGLLQSSVRSKVHSQTLNTSDQSGERTVKKNDYSASALQEFWTEGYP